MFIVDTPRVSESEQKPLSKNISPCRHIMLVAMQGASFLMHSDIESVKMANKKGLKADPWCRPTSTVKGALSLMVGCMSFNSLVKFSDTPCVSCTHTFLLSGLWRMFFFQDP